MTVIPTLKTERLFLRPFTLRDISRVEALLSTPEISLTTLSIRYPYPAGAAADWIGMHERLAQEGVGLHWAIVDRETRALMGAITLGINHLHRRGEIGYWLGPRFWNQGFMTEATSAVIAYGFGELGLHRIESSCFTRNPASARVLVKAGMVIEGVMRHYVRKNGTYEDVAMYAVIQPPK
jgi:RimJ/RimL family protein N-acetyltransferase